MKILQKILSHGLLIAFFVAVFFIYLYRVELFPQWFGSQVQTEVAPSESSAARAPIRDDEQAQAGQAAVQHTGQPETHPAATTEQLVAITEKPAVKETLSAPATAPQSEVKTADQPAAEGEVAGEPAPTSAADAGGAGQYRPVESQESARETYHPVADVPADVVTAPRYRPVQAKKTAPPPAGGADFQTQLDQARQLYWRRDLPAAEQAYRHLTESYPQRAEAWGELGNLYFSQREMVQATEVYHRAIELLIEQGDTGRASQMLGVMHQLDSDKARKLEERLSQGE